jgi:hypothetical protein
MRSELRDAADAGRCAEQAIPQTSVETIFPKETSIMTDTRELSGLELESQEIAELPDREALSLVNANVAAPINAALALNVLSDNSVAYANAQQTAPIVQGI